MLIDRIYQKVKTYVNTEGRGNVTPAEFNLMLHNAIQGRNEDYFFQKNRQTNRENRGLIENGLANTVDRLDEKIQHYIKEVEIPGPEESGNNYFQLPSDYRYIDDVVYKDLGVSIEPCKDKKEFNILKTQVTNDYPVYLKKGDALYVAPLLEQEIEVTYLRKVKFPKWTYTVVNNTEIFNPSANDFVDADIHPSEEDEMVKRVLYGFGVNLKEKDLQQAVANENATEFNQQNAN